MGKERRAIPGHEQSRPGRMDEGLGFLFEAILAQRGVALTVVLGWPTDWSLWADAVHSPAAMWMCSLPQ